MASGWRYRPLAWCRVKSVRLELGGVVPADVKLLDGSVLIDQSMLTGNR